MAPMISQMGDFYCGVFVGLFIGAIITLILMIGGYKQ